MPLSVNDQRHNHEKEMPGFLTPMLEETTQYQDVHVNDDTWVLDAPTLMLPVVGIDQWPTQASLQAIPGFRTLPAIGGVPLSEQPTWILPVIPGSHSHASQTATIQKTGHDGYWSLLRDLVKSSGLYAIASLTSPLVSLLLSPFLAHVLSRTNYGALVVLNTFVTLVAGITELGLGAAYIRMHTYDCKTPKEQFDALSTLLMLMLFILVPVTLLGEVIAPWLSVLFLGSEAYSMPMRIAVVLVLVQNLTIPGLVWLRADRRPDLFSAVSIFNLLATATANIVLVGFWHMGIAGSLVANGLGDVIIIICTIPLIIYKAGIHLRVQFAWSMFAFGAPHAMNFISGWVLQLADRYLLAHFTSLSVVASYSVSYSMGSILSAAIISPFSFAWWVLMFPIAKRDDAGHVFKLIFRWFSLVLLFAAFGLSLVGIGILHIFFPRSYLADSSIIPIITLSTLFNGIFIVVNLGPSLKSKTWLTSLYFVCSALINIGLNIVLIPLLGTMGAALATLIAYVVLALVAYLVNRLIYPVSFEVGLFLISLSIGIALYLAGSEFVQGQGVVLTAAIYGSLCVLYGIALLVIGWLPHLARNT